VGISHLNRAVGALSGQNEVFVQLPAIHMNGSGRKNLLDDVLDSRAALNKTIEVLARFGPNMRDYYVLPDGDVAFHRAIAEHVSRVERLRAIVAEFDLLAEGIDKGGAFLVQVVDGAVIDKR
jgi:uncharacterized lipoprotein YddW (UPF0748 family)